MREPGDPPPDGLLQPHTLPPRAGSLHLLQGLPALLQSLERKEKETFMLFSGHNGSLLRPQPRARTIGHSSSATPTSLPH